MVSGSGAQRKCEPQRKTRNANGCYPGRDRGVVSISVNERKDTGDSAAGISQGASASLMQPASERCRSSRVRIPEHGERGEVRCRNSLINRPTCLAERCSGRVARRRSSRIGCTHRGSNRSERSLLLPTSFVHHYEPAHLNAGFPLHSVWTCACASLRAVHAGRQIRALRGEFSASDPY